jgi:hypothetical protein
MAQAEHVGLEDLAHLGERCGARPAAVEILQRRSAAASGARDAGVVDEHIESAELFADARERGRDRLELRHVEAERSHIALQ